MGIPPAPTDLNPLPLDAQLSQPTSTFAKHIHDLHVEIHRKIVTCNDSYKLPAEVRHKDISFKMCVTLL